MLRRNIMALAAVLPIAALTARAFAQEAAPTPTTKPMDGAMPAMGEAETTHAKDTGMVGSLSLLQSRLAVEKASDPKVKMFATWEVAEQETVGDILKSMMDDAPDSAQGALQPPTDDEAMAMVDAAGKTKLDELKGLSGADFDKAYVAANLEGHKKLLTIQETYLKAGANREHLSVAKLARGSVKEHIDHLEELTAML